MSYWGKTTKLFYDTVLSCKQTKDQNHLPFGLALIKLVRVVVVVVAVVVVTDCVDVKDNNAEGGSGSVGNAGCTF